MSAPSTPPKSVGSPAPEIPSVSLDQQITQRKSKLKSLQDAGLNPFPYRFERTHRFSEIFDQYKDLAQDGEGKEIVITAGRLITLRDMGKTCFAHLADGVDRLQIYVKKDVVGEETFKLFQKDFDLGDFAGVEGTMFRTRTGELTLRATKITMLTKSLRPLPEKFHGLKDVDTRYRQRELDLISNKDVQTLFILRSKMIRSLRETLYAERFLEVETPLLQAQAGGAAARPFETYHNALEMPLFMRIAPELYLKRLLVGGMERVFEIGRVFRNEGIDTKHNPEFTLLEAYQAYADYNDMMDLSEKLIVNAAMACTGSLEVMLGEKPLSLKTPFARSTMSDLFIKHAGYDATLAWREGKLRQLASDLHVGTDESLAEHKVFDRLFDAKVKPHLWEPTFVLDYPVEISPLAKKHRTTPGLVERFELYVACNEMANAYSELNDPVDQRERMEKQSALKKTGDDEAELADEGFLAAIEQGMPPAGGLGVGVDRLAMLLLGQTSIREVILFPLLKPENT